MSNSTFSDNKTFQPIATPAVLYTWFIGTFLISIVGTIISVTLMIIVLCQNARDRRSSILICSLLFIDLLNVAVFATVDRIIIFRAQLGYKDTILCPAVAFFRSANIGATYWSAAVLALNRFIASYFPHQYKPIFSFGKTIIYVISCWMLPACLEILLLTRTAGFSPRMFPLGNCGIMPLQPKLFTLITTVEVPLPLAIQGMAYICLAGKLFKRGKVNPEQPDKSVKRQRQITLGKILMISFIWHLVCFLPVPLTNTIRPGYWVGHEMALLGLKALELCGSAGTPVIFILLGNDYQVGLKSLLRAKRVKPIKGTVSFGKTGKNSTTHRTQGTGRFSRDQ